MMISSVCLSKRFGSAKAFMICVEGVHPSGVQDGGGGGGRFVSVLKHSIASLVLNVHYFTPLKSSDTKTSKAQKNVL